MTDYPASLDRMLAAWNEPESSKVRSHLDAALSPEVHFVDPSVEFGLRFESAEDEDDEDELTDLDDDEELDVIDDDPQLDLIEEPDEDLIMERLMAYEVATTETVEALDYVRRLKATNEYKLNRELQRENAS